MFYNDSVNKPNLQKSAHIPRCQSAKWINQSGAGRKCQVPRLGDCLAGHLRGTEERGPGKTVTEEERVKCVTTWGLCIGPQCVKEGHFSKLWLQSGTTSLCQHLRQCQDHHAWRLNLWGVASDSEHWIGCQPVTLCCLWWWWTIGCHSVTATPWFLRQLTVEFKNSWCQRVGEWVCKPGQAGSRFIY